MRRRKGGFRYWCPRSNAYSFTFISSLLYYDAFVHDRDKYIPNGPIFPDYSPTLVDQSFPSFHVVHYMKTCAKLASTTTTAIPDHYTSLLPSSASYKRILLEACTLVPSITDYIEFIPLSNPSIFASSHIGELPIIIDTGASCSITPPCSDFIEESSTPDSASLGSLTSTDTAVVGQSQIQWDIEDFHGTL